MLMVVHMGRWSACSSLKLGMAWHFVMLQSRSGVLKTRFSVDQVSWQSDWYIRVPTGRQRVRSVWRRRWGR